MEREMNTALAVWREKRGFSDFGWALGEEQIIKFFGQEVHL